MAVVLLGLFQSACVRAQDGRLSGKTFEVALFEGAFSLYWYRQMASQYEALHPDLHIRMWGSPRVSDKVRPRILRRDPPEIVLADLPVWLLIKGNRLQPLNRWLDQPAYGDTTGRWRDTFLPGVLDVLTHRGNVYGVPVYFGGYVVFYNRGMFRQHGWEVPRTWDEFERLCKTIKAAGIAPFAFHGKYPVYAQAIYFSLLQRIGGLEVIQAIDDLTPHCFQSTANVETARLLQHIAQDYFQPGCMAMNHIEAQSQFIFSKTAMVACGLWLRKEMEDKMPADFELSCFDWPPLNTDIPYCWHGGGGAFLMSFVDAPERAAAVEFMRYMTAKENMRVWVTTNAALSPIKNAADGLSLSLDLAAALEYIQKATVIFSSQLPSRYPELQQAHVEAIRQLITAEISPEAFCEQMEAKAEAVRRNPRRDVFPPSTLPEAYLKAR
jgi:N-acetylglucosamine transport system substrate-binding protein